MRFGMLKEHAELIGKTKAFDGATLYLPHRLPKPVSVHTFFFLFKRDHDQSV